MSQITGHQVLLAVPKDLKPGDSSASAVILPESDADSCKLASEKPFFFTTFDTTENVIHGYRVDNASLKIAHAWNIKLGKGKEIVKVETQYNSASTASQQSHILPTSFGQNGELIYKYLD
jgi:hypothetical protein